MKTITFQDPDRCPLKHDVTKAGRQSHGRALDRILEKYPQDFEGTPGVKGLDIDRTRKGEQVDRWQCVWQCEKEGYIGYVVNSPLADWSALRNYKPPKVSEVWDVARVEETGRSAPRKFRLASGGWLWQRMFWLRGLEKLLVDIALGRKEVIQLRDMVMDFQRVFVEKSGSTGCDGIWFLDDWGTQNNLMIRPETWRELFKDCYRELFSIVHQSGKKVFFHSDGNITSIVGDLVEIGADVVNLQLPIMDTGLVKKAVQGKSVVLGGLDLQKILPYGKPEDTAKHIRDLLDTFSMREGGYIGQMILDAEVPLENAEKICEIIYLS